MGIYTAHNPNQNYYSDHIQTNLQAFQCKRQPNNEDNTKYHDNYSKVPCHNANKLQTILNKSDI